MRMRSFSSLWMARVFSTTSQSQPQHLLPGLQFWPRFLSPLEQNVLLAASLHKLDSLETRRWRQRRKDHFSSRNHTGSPSGHANLDIFKLFAPDELYDFQEGHFDGVIHHYRETHLTQWPFEVYPHLNDVITRIHQLCPTPDIQTHLLHLASYGKILPHVDNVNASGSWILGVSLGGERLLRLKQVNNPEAQEFALVLPSGSVYLQRDDIRFEYEHSIDFIEHSAIGSPNPPTQRLSVMIRDRNTFSP